MGQHDSAYKLLFSDPHLVEFLIRGFLPGAWIDSLDFDSLEPASEAHPRDNLDVRYDDVIWRLRWRGSRVWVYVYLILEFQSNDEPFMAVRVLDYDAGLYRQLVKTLRLKRGDPLPIVVPVVLYRGQPAWRSATEVYDLIAPAPAELEPYLPRLRYLLIDANAYPAKQLQAMRNPVACILWLEATHGLEPAMAPIDLLNEVLDRPEHAGLRRAMALWLTQVHLRSRLPGVTVPPVEKLEEVKPMIEANAIDWTIPWQEEGRKKGRQEGEAALLLRQLTRRFGPLSPAVQERVRDADADQLLVWGERFVTATELDEVFET